MDASFGRHGLGVRALSSLDVTYWTRSTLAVGRHFGLFAASSTVPLIFC